MDEPEFEIFYTKTARKLHAYIHRISGNGALADDILQDAYCRFLRATLPPMDEGQTRSYLYRIATNLLRDHYRKRKTEETNLAYGGAGEPFAAEYAGRREILDAMEALNGQERSLLWLAYVEGENHRDIAKILGLKEKSIRVLLFRARGKLAGILRVKSS